MCRKNGLAFFDVAGALQCFSIFAWKFQTESLNAPHHHMKRIALIRLRLAGLIEGTSFLVLLFIAMPLKYGMDMPMAVKIVGWIHGVLFLYFCMLLLQTLLIARWKLSRAALFFVAALIPFGPFIVDKKLKEEIASAKDAAGA